MAPLGLIHSNPQVCEQERHVLLRDDSARHKTKAGHSPRQRLNDPDHKLPFTEVAMADQANTPKPRERQDDRYERALPIGAVVHKLMRDFAKRVAE